MYQPLVTAEQREQLLANTRRFALGGLHDIEQIQPVVRLFTPDAHATWLLAWLDPMDHDMAYGLCDLGFGKPSLARIRLSDLGAIVGPAKKPVCRDRFFRPTRPLWDYAYHSFMDGSIPD